MFVALYLSGGVLAACCGEARARLRAYQAEITKEEPSKPIDT